MEIKPRIIIIFLVSLIVLLVSVPLVFYFLLFPPISKKERAEIYSYFSDDDNYVEICGKLIEIYSQSDGSGWWSIRFDEEFISENQELFNKENQELFNNLYFNTKGIACGITKKTYAILLENGFYDLLLDESEIDETAEEPFLIEENICIITTYDSAVYWLERPVVEVRVGDTVYLDYETGKANFLDWIQNDLK